MAFAGLAEPRRWRRDPEVDGSVRPVSWRCDGPAARWGSSPDEHRDVHANNPALLRVCDCPVFGKRPRLAACDPGNWTLLAAARARGRPTDCRDLERARGVS